MAKLNIDDTHLARLRDHYARYGALPSYAGIGKVVGFQAKNAAVKLAKRLSDAGYLKTAPGGKLAPTERFFELPVVDVPVRAGMPEPVECQLTAESMTLDGFLVEAPSKTILVRVKGDSMCDAGILDGDLAVVERTDVARPGQFVVVMVDEEFTLKELQYENQRPILVPHNSQFPVIRPAGNLQIFGVVRGIVRRYAGKPLRHHLLSGASS
jgi:repressor LexA